MSEFHFNTKLDQTLLIGRKAKNLKELLSCVREVPDSSIYYHTHRFLQQHHYLSPEPPNDFAYWLVEVLNEKALGEQLSSIDIVQFHTIAELRNRFIEILQAGEGTEPAHDCPRGEEFHFMASRTFVLTTELVAHDLREFLDILKRISISSIYYHMFDAKLRLEKGENDFSRWFKDIGYKALSENLMTLDPYTHTLEGLRKRIIALGEKHAAH
jgi:hypothetical protein